MSVATKNPPPEQVFNVPNQITAMRLVLSIVLFVLLPLEYYLAGMVVFIVAAATDWVDGYYARKYGQVTTLGRILDPFVDKIIICGSFIYLAAVGPSSLVPARALPPGWRWWWSGASCWSRRCGHFWREKGPNFSATMSGKLKMVCQCTAVGSQPVCADVWRAAPARMARLAAGR